MTYHDNHNLYAAPLPLEGSPGLIQPKPLILIGRARRERERNWGLFDSGGLRAVYTIDPHVILHLTEHHDLIEARAGL